MANDSPLHGFYNSPAWRTFSAMIRSSRFHICELCGSPDASEVHHLVHINKHNVTDPAVTLNEDNVMLLCRHCHYSIHERGKYRNRRSLFDACGNIAKVKEPHTSTLTPLQLATIRERERAARISIAQLHQHPLPCRHDDTGGDLRPLSSSRNLHFFGPRRYYNKNYNYNLKE